MVEISLADGGYLPQNPAELRTSVSQLASYAPNASTSETLTLNIPRRCQVMQILPALTEVYLTAGTGSPDTWICTIRLLINGQLITQSVQKGADVTNLLTPRTFFSYVLPAPIYVDAGDTISLSMSFDFQAGGTGIDWRIQSSLSVIANKLYP